MCLHVAWKMCYNDDDDNDSSDNDNCANGADELLCIVVGKVHAEAIGVVALCKKINTLFFRPLPRKEKSQVKTATASSKSC